MKEKFDRASLSVREYQCEPDGGRKFEDIGKGERNFEEINK